jgi:hypothetical protein
MQNPVNPVNRRLWPTVFIKEPLVILLLPLVPSTDIGVFLEGLGTSQELERVTTNSCGDQPDSPILVGW